MFNETIDDYYKPILVRFAFDNNFEEHEIRGDKHKNLTLKEYLVTITPQLTNLIEEKKNSTQDEQKVQLTMAIIFKHITNPIKKYTIYVKSKNIEIRTKDDTDDTPTHSRFINDHCQSKQLALPHNKKHEKTIQRSHI